RAAPAVRPCRRRGEFFRGSLVRGGGRGARGGAAHRSHCDSGRRYRPLLQHVDPRPCRGAADPGGDPRAGSRAPNSDGVAALHAELKWRDPAAAARLMPGDRARITRALEVVLATGRSLLDWHDDNKPPGLDAAQAAKVFLMPDRDELLRRIDARFDAMMAAGALDEVRALAARQLDPALPAMKAHGVPWLI